MKFEELDPLATLCLERCTLDFAMSSDCMACYARIVLHPAPEPEHANEDGTEDDPAVAETANESEQPQSSLAHDVLSFLRNYKINSQIDYSAVYELCAAIETGASQELHVVARGVEPQTGADGWFELTVCPPGDGVGNEDDRQGRIDPKEVHLFDDVDAEAKLGIVHSPAAGVPGVDIFGQVVPAAAGQDYLLSAGEGVALKYGGRVAYAERSGRVLFEKQRISVVDYLLIPGDLSMATGNIDFHGFVEIKGDVPDDFSVRASKGIKIHGYAGGSRLESGGPLELVAMAGKEVGRIICQGDLAVKFLNQVHVDCYADVYVEREIRNSSVNAKGKIMVGGGIIGGRTVALAGIEAKTLGASSGLQTLVTAGVYFPDMERFDYLRQQLDEAAQRICTIESAVPSLENYLEQHHEASAAAVTRLKVLKEQLDELYLEKDALEAEQAASTPQEFDCRNPKINVLQSLCEGVVITLGRVREVIRLARRGPVSIIENSQEGTLYFLSYSALQLLARQLEEELITREEDSADADAEDL